ncbi:MAG: hypothetical protein WDM80_09495 [Limisphaerales bacterium]
MSSNQANIPKKVPLSFCGLQFVSGGLYMALWNCLEDTHDGLVKDSTVSEASLLKLGYLVPNPIGLKRGDIVNV